MYQQSIFKVQTNDMERIVMSTNFIDELNALPDGALSTVEAAYERYCGTIECIRTSSLQSDACRIHLTHKLQRLIQPMSEEVHHWVKALVAHTRDQHAESSAYHNILSVVVGITSRVLVGEPLCHDDAWLEVARGYTMDVVHASAQLRQYPRWLRRFVGPRLHCVRRLSMREAMADKLLWKIAVEASSDTKLASKRANKPESLFQWMAGAATGQDRCPSLLVRKTLFLTLAGVHTVTTAVVHALFDLCAHPEYAEPLRKEARASLDKNGCWTLPALNGLKRLDSFMKESQRVNHPGLFSFNRKVMRPVLLPEGTLLPAGSIISMPTAAIANDPSKYPDPHIFSGWRFYELQKCYSATPEGKGGGSGDQGAAQNQYVSTSPDSLPFGYGRSACPGRFYAAAQIKLILAAILLEYDVRFPEGQSVRPDNVHFGEGIMPDRTQRVLFLPL